VEASPNTALSPPDSRAGPVIPALPRARRQPRRASDHRMTPGGLLVDAAAAALAAEAAPSSSATAAGAAAGAALLLDHEYTAFVDSCLDLDSELQDGVHASPGEPIAGSTACMLLVRGTPPPPPGRAAAAGAADRLPTLICANVGDSRAVLCRGGAIVELSFDHKPSRADERARIEAAGGTVVKDRVHGVLAVSRAFGDAEHKRGIGQECWGREFSADPVTAEPEVTHEPLQPADEFAVIASDGVYDVMTSQQLVNFVRRKLLAHRDVARASREVVRKAIALGSIDNVSAVVVAFQPMAAAAP
jgi:serine/threonine protein phosphatase PrpC